MFPRHVIRIPSIIIPVWVRVRAIFFVLHFHVFSFIACETLISITEARVSLLQIIVLGGYCLQLLLETLHVLSLPSTMGSLSSSILAQPSLSTCQLFARMCVLEELTLYAASLLLVDVELGLPGVISRAGEFLFLLLCSFELGGDLFRSNEDDHARLACDIGSGSP